MPGIEPLAAATAGLRPEKVLGFIEAVLVEWNHTFEEEPQQRITLELPVDKAHQFGFVTAEAQHEHMAEARAATLRGMDDFITRFEGTGEAGERVQQLREARGSVRDFSRLARLYGRRKRLGFRPVRATWRWPRGAVVSEVLVGSPPEVVHWLATEAYKQSSLLLEESMQAAWHWAFDRHGFRGDLPTDDVTPTDTEGPSPFDELITGHRAITPRGSSAGHADPTR
ncbi:hypothetical protein ACFW5D_34315 [Streptomyces sp. NPDC058770]|uniref:hypothetical protein n=1 Tax=Streptomyces sp. NPDC058770 TaxID=3346631 RepID=UPI0036C22AEB